MLLPDGHPLAEIFEQLALHDPVVQVVAADGHAVQAEDNRRDAAPDPHHRHVERAAAEVEDQHGLRRGQAFARSSRAVTPAIRPARRASIRCWLDLAA